MDDKRLQYVDMAKGIAILVIVLYHLTAPGIISSVCTHIASAMLALFFLGLLFFPLADATLRSTKKTLLTAAALLVATGIIRGFGVNLPYNLQLIPFWADFMLLGSHSMTVYIYHMFLAWVIGVFTGRSPLPGGEGYADAGQVLQSLLVICVVLAMCVAIAIIRDRILARMAK